MNFERSRTTACQCLSLAAFFGHRVMRDLSPQAFQCFALMQINRQPLSGRNVLRRNVSLFEEMSHG
jgi:hypothetical protein